MRLSCRWDESCRRLQRPWPPAGGGQNKPVTEFRTRGPVLPAVGHTIVLAFWSSLSRTVRLFRSHPMRINIWLCVSTTKVRFSDHGLGQLVWTIWLVITPSIIPYQTTGFGILSFFSSWWANWLPRRSTGGQVSRSRAQIDYLQLLLGWQRTRCHGPPLDDH